MVAGATETDPGQGVCRCPAMVDQSRCSAAASARRADPARAHPRFPLRKRKERHQRLARANGCPPLAISDRGIRWSCVRFHVAQPSSGRSAAGPEAVLPSAKCHGRNVPNADVRIPKSMGKLTRQSTYSSALIVNAVSGWSDPSANPSRPLPRSQAPLVPYGRLPRFA